MSKLTFAKELGTPSTPPAGFVRFYAEDSALRYIDESGVVRTLATGISPDEVEDIVATLVTNSSTISWVYDDPNATLTATVDVAQVNHNALLNYVPAEHVNHSSVSINAGAGLTGGGDLTETRTISMPDVATAGTYGGSDKALSVTIDQKGRVTSIVVSNISILATAVSNLASAVLEQVLTGFVIGANAAISATDSILAAFQKTQGQLNALFSRNINTSTGLTGGGNLTADRTLALADTTVTPGTYGGSNIPQITVDQQGRITNASNGPQLVLGDNFENFSDTTPATTTANTNSVAASWTTLSKQTGEYRIGINWTWTISSNTSDAIFSLFVDDTQVGQDFRQEVSETSKQNNLQAYFSYVTFSTVQTHTIELRFRAETAGVTVTVNQVVMEIWRVA